MSISIVGTPSEQVVFGTSLSFTIPSSAVDDDLVIVITGSTYAAVMSTSPSMTLIGPVSSSTPATAATAVVYAFYARASDLGGASATVTVSDPTNNNLAAGMIVFHSSTGLPTLLPADTTAFASSSSTATSATAPSIPVDYDGILLFAGKVNYSGTQSYTAAPSGYTDRGSAARAYASVHLATKSVSAGGNSGTAADTASQAGQWVAAQFLICDTPPVSVSIDDPTAAGQTAGYEHVAGSVAVTFTADNATNVDFTVDGDTIASGVGSPYSWDSTATPNGTHTIGVTGTNDAGNDSDSVDVMVNNNGRWSAPDTPVTTYASS
ncbi:MAG TPA: Ig-like domain-containing protein [Candidatus Saccharimonadales bacterium]|nr:Ig-like domain-containing protein [Candidatus Saccharimonadales bacterium]